MKKFYTVVSHHQTANGFEIQLDGKVMRTPVGSAFFAPNAALADSIVQEWAAQEDEIDAKTMPITQIIITCIDRVNRERSEMMPQVMAYFDTDLICYLHDDPTLDVYKWQDTAWSPWRKWFQSEYGTDLATTAGLLAITQDPDTKKRLNDEVAQMSDLKFTAFQLITAMSGSFVMALAFMKNAIDANTLFEACFVEELYRAKLYNEEFYGHAPHQEKKMVSMKQDLAAARTILDQISS